MEFLQENFQLIILIMAAVGFVGMIGISLAKSGSDYDDTSRLYNLIDESRNLFPAASATHQLLRLRSRKLYQLKYERHTQSEIVELMEDYQILQEEIEQRENAEKNLASETMPYFQTHDTMAR